VANLKRFDGFVGRRLSVTDRRASNDNYEKQRACRPGDFGFWILDFGRHREGRNAARGDLMNEIASGRQGAPRNDDIPNLLHFYSSSVHHSTNLR
jgi:hypothetical protein